MRRIREGAASHEVTGREEGRRKTLPFWVKFLWFWPEFRIVVDEVDGQVNCHSLRNDDSVDLNGLLSNS